MDSLFPREVGDKTRERYIIFEAVYITGADAVH